MPFIGADLEDLRALAALMDRCGATLENTRKRINSLVFTAEWEGGEGERFRAAWPAYSQRLESASGALHRAATHIRTEAEQQESASAGGSFNAGSAGWAGLDHTRPPTPGDVHKEPSIWHRVAGAMRTVGSIEEAGFKSDLHTLDRVQREVVASQAFKDTVDGMHVAGTVMGMAAPIALLIPGAGEVIAPALLAGALLANAGAMAGDGAEMADGDRKFSKGQLLGDAVAVGASVVGAGEGAVAAKAAIDGANMAVGDGAAATAADSRLANLAATRIGSAVLDAGDSLQASGTSVKAAINVVDAATRVYTLGASAHDAYGDVKDGNYLAAAGSALQFADAGHVEGGQDITDLPSDPLSMTDSVGQALRSTNDAMDGGVHQVVEGMSEQ